MKKVFHVTRFRVGMPLLPTRSMLHDRIFFENHVAAQGNTLSADSSGSVNVSDWTGNPDKSPHESGIFHRTLSEVTSHR